VLRGRRGRVGGRRCLGRALAGCSAKFARSQMSKPPSADNDSSKSEIRNGHLAPREVRPVISVRAFVASSRLSRETVFRTHSTWSFTLAKALHLHWWPALRRSDVSGPPTPKFLAASEPLPGRQNPQSGTTEYSREAVTYPFHCPLVYRPPVLVDHSCSPPPVRYSTNLL